ncbi:MAG: dTDP-4-amino-4,6-dideoxygalactose transaminase [Flavobacteriales bacterium]
MIVPFNLPHLTGKETHFIYDAVNSGKISGNGKYTKKCQTFFEEKYGFKKCLLTTSCTDALEMSAILLNIQPGDEVIIPSYTFVSTANAFVLRGAKIIFADSSNENPNIDATKIESLITSKTKAIVVVHYAGMACDMDMIMDIAKRHNIFVVEDAAQAVDSFYKGVPLGKIGHMSTFSFHETKNIISGEGGMLVINDEQFIDRAEIIWEKGTNRSAFFRGEIDKYGWVDVGSSFLPSEVISAFLYAQLENMDSIQNKRKTLWNQYYNAFSSCKEIDESILPKVPEYATNNAHMFYMVCSSIEERNNLIAYLKQTECQLVFHYLSLHKSPFFEGKYEGENLVNSDNYTERLVRLPLYFDLSNANQALVIKGIKAFYSQNKKA